MSEDLIGRQAAIDAIDKYIGTFDAIDRNYLDGLRKAKSLLYNFPSAQRKGKIIIWSNMLDGEDCYCSKCDHWGLMPDYEFCPYCGVAFEDVITEGEEDENNNQI